MQLRRRNTLSVYNEPEDPPEGKDGRLSPEPVLGRLGQLSSPDVSAPVRHVRTPSPIRHPRTPVILILIPIVTLVRATSSSDRPGRLAKGSL